MNLVNFNDDLVLPCDFESVSEYEMPNTALRSPIFEWHAPSVDFATDPCIITRTLKEIESGSAVLPFPTMRLFLTPNPELASLDIERIKIWMHRHDDGTLNARLLVEGKGQDLLLGVESAKGGEHFYLGMGDGVKNRTAMTPLSLYPSLVGENMGFLAREIVGMLCWFIREASLPSNFIASVTPDKKGKPVEWMKARTHYVILHKAHPANSKQVAVGSTVTRSSESIKRQAHTRRAHARILRSPRFRNKTGQTIYVKATWVGPSEWKENRSIYRMVPHKN
jgi:hypothetical protein